jgi:hypothetical protein
MKTNEEYKATDANNLLAAGLFNLEEFHGWPPTTVNNYFKDKGWESIDCFNDYKRAWVNRRLNKSIVAKTAMVDEDALGNEMIVDIWWYDGIYSE